LKIFAVLVEVSATNSLHRQTPAVDPGIPQHRHAVFDAGGAVGDLAEVVAARGFLLGAEAAVVGGGGVQVAGLQAAPQRLLVLARAERRAHHVTGGGGPVRVTVDAVVQQQVAGQYFAVNRLALGRGIGDFIQRLAAGDVHQVQRCAQGFGDADGAAGRLAFNLRRARQGCASGPVMPWAISTCAGDRPARRFPHARWAPRQFQAALKLATSVSSAAMIAFL
jgi:hypothetical protein